MFRTLTLVQENKKLFYGTLGDLTSRAKGAELELDANTEFGVASFTLFHDSRGFSRISEGILGV